MAGEVFGVSAGAEHFGGRELDGGGEVHGGGFLEAFDLLRCGRKAGDVKGEAADDAVGIGGGVGDEVVLLMFGADEGVDGVVSPLGFGRGGFDGLDEGPVFLVRGALLDPFAEESDLVGIEGRFVALGRRHDVVLVFGGDAFDEG